MVYLNTGEFCRASRSFYPGGYCNVLTVGIAGGKYKFYNAAQYKWKLQWCAYGR